MARHHHVVQRLVHHLAEPEEGARHRPGRRRGESSGRKEGGHGVTNKHHAFHPDALLHGGATTRRRHLPVGKPAYFGGTPPRRAPGWMPRAANQPRLISRAYLTGCAAQCDASLWGSMSAMLTIVPRSSMYATDSGSSVFFIHMQWIARSSKMNSIPAFDARFSRCIRPRARVAGLETTSATMRYMPALNSAVGLV